MGEKAFKEQVKRIREVNAVIGKLDPSIRGDVFQILKPYIAMQAESGRDAPPAGDKLGDVGDASSFFSAYKGKNKAENAVLAAAYLYSQYGSEAFSLDDIRRVADEVGIPIPARLDMTIASAKREGAGLFRRVKKGWYRPTVNAENYFKTNYKLRKGAKKRPVTEQP